MTDNLRSIAHWATALAPSPLLRYQQRGRYAVVDGVTLVSFDLPGPSFNTATVLGPAPPPEKVLALASDFFGGTEGAWGVTVDADTGHPVEAELRARGWPVVEDDPALVLPVIPPAPAAPPGLAIRGVVDEATLVDYATAAEAGFAPPADPTAPRSATSGPYAGINITRALIPSVACTLDPDIALFVGYAGDRPVATSALYRIDRIAEIAGVATIPAYRRRGYGEAMTWAALAEGAARGCASAALRASEMGYPVYIRMGFVPVCRFRTYAPP